MTQRKLTVGTKVRINCKDSETSEFYNKIGKVVYCLPEEDWDWPYTVEIKIGKRTEECPFARSELVRINKKRKAR
jgi:hypothetical protein